MLLHEVQASGFFQTGHVVKVVAHVIFAILEVPELLHATFAVRVELVNDVAQDDAVLARFAQRLVHRLAYTQPRPQRVGHGLGLPAFQIRAIRQDQISQSGFFAHERAHGHKIGNQLFVLVQLAPHRHGAGVGVDRVVLVGEVHVDFLFAFGNPERHQMADLVGCQRVIGWLRKEGGLGRLARLRRGLWPAHAARQAVAAFLFDVARHDGQHHAGAFVVRAIQVLGRAAVGEQSGRLGSGKFTGDALDGFHRNARNLGCPFRCVLLVVGLQLSHRDIGPVGDEVGVVQVFTQDDMTHRQGDCSVGAREDWNPLVREACRVGQAHVKRDDLHLVFNNTLGDALRQRVVKVGRLQNVGAKVEHVLGIGKVWRLDVRAPCGFHAHFFGRFTHRSVVDHGCRSQGFHESTVRTARAVTPVLQHDGVGVFLDGRVELLGQLGQGFVPGDALPLALAACTHTLKRVQDAIRVVAVPHAGVALGAQATASGDVLGVAFELDHAVIFQKGNGAVLNVAHMAIGRDCTAYNRRDRVDVLAAQVVFHCVQQLRSSGSCGACSCAHLQKGAAFQARYFHLYSPR